MSTSSSVPKRRPVWALSEREAARLYEERSGYRRPQVVRPLGGEDFDPDMPVPYRVTAAGEAALAGQVEVVEPPRVMRRRRERRSFVWYTGLVDE